MADHTPESASYSSIFLLAKDWSIKRPFTVPRMCWISHQGHFRELNWRYLQQDMPGLLIYAQVLSNPISGYPSKCSKYQLLSTYCLKDGTSYLHFRYFKCPRSSLPSLFGWRDAHSTEDHVHDVTVHGILCRSHGSHGPMTIGLTRGQSIYPLAIYPSGKLT